MRRDTSNPYVGLRPFDVDESILFFGRNEQTLELLDRLHDHHFVAVVGSSGSGKSSLLRAGLIPALKAGYLIEDSDRWLLAIMKPGLNPLYNLTESILLQINSKTDSAEVELFVQKIEEEGADALIQLLSPLKKKQNINFFLLVDQFEELFRYAMEDKDIARQDKAIDFVHIILEMASQNVIPFFVVITMRSDFIGDCAQFYGLPEAMNKSQYLVPRLNRVQLKMVIEGPAKLYGIRINPSLTSRLLNELGKVDDGLPLLQHALMRIWDFEVNVNKDGELDLEDSKSIGGLEKALSNHADEALVGLSPEELNITKKLFQSLTTIDENGRKIRRPVLLSKLEKLTGGTKQQILKIIHLFIEDKRSFLVVNETSDSDDKIIDISHESLIRQWETLSKWVDEEGESASSYLHLLEAANLYNKGKKDFLTGSELQLALDWRNKYKPSPIWANRYKQGFEDCMLYLNASEADRALKLKIEATRKQIKRSLVSLIIGLLVIVAVGGILLTVAANKAKLEAETQTQLSQSLTLAAFATEQEVRNSTIAMRLAELAWHKSPVQPPSLAIQRVVSKVFYESLNNKTPYYSNNLLHSNIINNGVFSADGKTILTCSADSTAKLWDAGSGKVKASLTGHQGQINSAEFSPDGKIIVTASDDNTAIIWDANTGKELRPLSGHENKVISAEFSPACPDDPNGGKRVVTASWDNTAIIWDTETGKVFHTLSNHIEGVYSAKFSPDGKKVVTASRDKTAKIWDVETGKEIRTLKGHVNDVYYAEFSPACPDDPVGGKTIVTASRDKTAKIWDAETGNLIHTLTGHEKDVYRAKFSPACAADPTGGKKIVTASSDFTAKLWDSETGTELRTLSGHKADVVNVSFSPNGEKIVTASADKTAKVWDAKTGKTLLTLTGHTDKVNNAVFSPACPDDPIGGKEIVTVSDDYSAKIWLLSQRSGIIALKGHDDAVNDAVYSPACPDDPNGGKMIVTASADNTAKVWDAASGLEICTLAGHEDNVKSADFSPVCPDDPTGAKMVVTASWDKSAKLWNAETGKLIHTFNGHTDKLNSAVFSPACPDDPSGGKTIVTTSADATAKIWNVETGEEILTLIGHKGEIKYAEFSPNGKKVLTASVDSTAKIWDVQSGKELHTLGHNAEVVDAQFSPDGERIVTASWDNTAKIWDAESGKEIHTLANHGDFVTSATFSFDGKKIVTTSWDQTAKIWDSETGEELHTLTGHEGIVNTAVFSSDGKMVVTASGDNTAIIWDVESGKEIYTFSGHSDYVYNAAFSPGNKKILTASNDNTARIWLTSEGIIEWLDKQKSIYKITKTDMESLGIDFIDLDK